MENVERRFRRILFFCKECGALLNQEKVISHEQRSASTGTVSFNPAESNKNRKVWIVAVAIVVLVAAVLIGSKVLPALNSSESHEKQLVGSWYMEDYETPLFILYDDGTVMSGSGGEYGTWAVGHDNHALILEIEGYTSMARIESFENGFLTLLYDGDTIELHNSPW